MIDPSHKKQVIEKVAWCREKALERMNYQLPPVILQFDLVGRVAGKAYSNRFTVQLNEFFFIEYHKEMINEIVPHEIAHIVANNYYKYDCQHDDNWARVLWNIFEVSPYNKHLMGPYWEPSKRIYLLVCPLCKHEHRFKHSHYCEILSNGGIDSRSCADCKKNMVGARIMLDNG